jgi:hypothetical protein
MNMIRHSLKLGAVLALLLASGAAYADDPTGVLLRERGLTPQSNGPVAEFSDFGPCAAGTESYPFPNGQGYRCVRTQ